MPESFWIRPFRAGLDLLVPPRCGWCSASLPDRRTPLCAACLAKLEPVQEPWCPRCGEPYLNAYVPENDPASASHTCPRCMASPPAFETARSAWLFRGKLRETVNRLKFGGDLGGLRPLELLFAGTFAWQAGAHHGAEIVSVPPAPGKLRERGFDLAHRLALSLGREANLKTAAGVVESTGLGVEQASLRFADRQKNARKRFQAGKHRPASTIILVDDVCTTGATLNACSAILKDAGAERIYAFTLARTVAGESGDR